MAFLTEILEKGFVDLNDLETGRLVRELGDRTLLSLRGLDFLKFILHNPSIQSISKSLLGPCKLGHWLKYNARPELIEGWRTGGEEAGRRVLLVLAVAPGSQVIYYQGSHLHNLPVFRNIRNRGLPETSKTALENAGCIPVIADYPDGALVIIDARLYRVIEKGYIIKHAIVADGALSGDKLQVEEGLREKIEDIQSTIKINYEIHRSANKISP